MAEVGWGLPRQFVRKLGMANAPIIEIYRPVQSSTQLTTTKGEKKEAKIEGGENEAVKYHKNTYSQTTTVRQLTKDGKHRPKPLPDSDGIIDGEYEYWLQPENPTAMGMHMARCKISVEDNWNTDDGGSWVYTFDAIKDGTHDQVEWGTVTVTGGYLEATAVTFTEIPEDATE